jgi:L-rhamnose mutarotase
MTQYSWVLEVRPGYEEEYKKRHDEIWPDLAEDIRASGMRNYSIFRYGLILFGYFECEDIKYAIDYLSKSDANRRWGEYMAPIMKVEVDANTGWVYLLPKQWHQD